MNYSDKLKDPRWQKKRLEILSRDNFTCQSCHDATSTLHVHHRIYDPGKEPWEYSSLNFITLCESCHEFETNNLDNACKSLVRIMKVHFLANGIRLITQGLRQYENTHADEVCASALAYFLSDFKRSRFLVDEFLKSLEQPEEIKEQIKPLRKINSLQKIREQTASMSK